MITEDELKQIHALAGIPYRNQTQRILIKIRKIINYVQDIISFWLVYVYWRILILCGVQTK